MNTGLPYNMNELHELELSLVSWLRTLGLIRVPPGTAAPTTLLEFEPQIRNGTLLCELARTLQGRPPAGTIRSPRTSASAVSNIRKALESFRRLPRISHRYLWSEREIYKGDRGIILGLLEDLHKYQDGVADSSPYVTAAAPAPYCGGGGTK